MVCFVLFHMYFVGNFCLEMCAYVLLGSVLHSLIYVYVLLSLVQLNMYFTVEFHVF